MLLRVRLTAWSFLCFMTMLVKAQDLNPELFRASFGLDNHYCFIYFSQPFQEKRPSNYDSAKASSS
jgi:hypothetical protein